ncbi:MAG: FAD-dependent oxidoreductase [Desulfurococcales archaeon]|nr:FAD-dependent oxidoreductase [Desulfurococcales archaeon]MCE4628856.1 FAD-dependent oxidoreductase [Desulfurococcales archaeon]
MQLNEYMNKKVTAVTKRIVFLGGGTGGVIGALTLAEAKKKHGLDLEITVINKDEWHYMPPLWMDVAIEGLPIEKTRAPIKNLEKYGVKVIVNEATKVNPDERNVELADGSKVEYDYLFLTLGLRNGWEAYPGLADEGYHNYDPDAAQEFHKALMAFKGGKVTILVPEVPFRCGIYPIEFATVLGYKLKVLGIDAKITLLSPKMPNGMDITWGLGPDIRKLWGKYMAKFNIEVKLHDGLERIDKEKKVVVTRNYEEPYDLLVKVPPPRPPKVLEDPVFLFEHDKRFVKARPRDFRHPEYDDIFSTGEHSMPPVGLGTAGVFVHAATSKAVNILLEELYGVGEVHEFTPVACVAYSGDKGFLGVCEVEFNGQMYTWQKCYNVMESFAMKFVKRSFYQGWLDKLRI